MTDGHYDLDGLVRAITEVGVGRGDLVFTHVGVGMLGYPAGEPTEERAAELVDEAFARVLGPEGTLVIPTYSYTLTKRGETYDPATTPSDVGGFTNRFRSLPGVVRSADPLFSVAARGPLADAIVAGLPHDCFGPDCVYDRLRRLDGILCNVGVGFRYATFIHHAEQLLEVPYRYPKVFTGRVVANGAVEEQSWRYNVRPLGVDEALPDLRRLEAAADAAGAVRRARVGLGQVTAIEATRMFELCAAGVADHPWFLARGPAVPFERN